jgi:hypothetical protein
MSRTYGKRDEKKKKKKEDDHWASETTQQVREPGTSLTICLIPETHMVERTNSYKLSCDLHMCQEHTHTHTHIHTHSLKILEIFVISTGEMGASRFLPFTGLPT